MARIELTINRFKRGDKKKKKKPTSSFSGTVQIPGKEEIVNAELTGKRKNLPIRVRHKEDGNIFIIVPVGSDKLYFELKTRVPTGEVISRDCVSGRSATTGAFAHWSATMNIFD